MWVNIDVVSNDKSVIFLPEKLASEYSSEVQLCFGKRSSEAIVIASKDIKIQKSIEVTDSKIIAFSDTEYSVYTDKLKERNEKSKQYLNKLKDYYQQINNELDDLELSDKWNEKKIADLRHYLVENG